MAVPRNRHLAAGKIIWGVSGYWGLVPPFLDDGGDWGEVWEQGSGPECGIFIVEQADIALGPDLALVPVRMTEEIGEREGEQNVRVISCNSSCWFDSLCVFCDRGSPVYASQIPKGNIQ